MKDETLNIKEMLHFNFFFNLFLHLRLYDYRPKNSKINFLQYESSGKIDLTYIFYTIFSNYAWSRIEF